MGKKWILLEPIQVGNTVLKNRIVMPPMFTCSSRPDGSVTRTTIDYYSERAKGGIGAIIVEFSYVDNIASRAAPGQLGIYNDHMLAGLNELAEAIKAHGTTAFIQLHHGGRECWPTATGRPPVAPSAIPCGVVGVIPKELTITEIEAIQEAFADAAGRAKRAGFDGVEVHGAHGYLICEFLSPYTNRRTDKYGGDLENRARFPLEVVKKTRDKVGDRFVVGYRMSADEYVPGGLTLEETRAFAKMLETAGVDYVHVSGGIYESAPHTLQPLYVEKAHNVHLAQGIKEAVSMPVVTVGAHDIHTAEEALEQGKADLAAMGRTLIADPELPKKLASGRAEDIRPCIRGSEGCSSRVDAGMTMRCEVNPACCREESFRIAPALTKKKVMIIGGGIAGLEAARVAALRGHKVTVVEKGERLGGHLAEATVPTFKEDTKRLVEWSINQVQKMGVKVQLKTEATRSLIEEAVPDVLIIAVGSDFVTPQVPGCDKACAMKPDDVLLGRQTVGDRVVVVGAGLIGCETALYLAEEYKKTVAIVEMLGEMLTDVPGVCQMALTARLKEAGVEIHLGWHLDEIRDNGVVCSDKKWEKHEIEADSVILATGLRERKEQSDRFQGLAPEVYAIGDCVRARKIYNCFEDAWRVALQI
jgi:2,4-dienoyl-CoA reductase-like NADH-dependent reductase (Old Yellow Enzyme family)/thioredoxin reductase